jgi:parallel beta-helix repeat protein
MSNVTRRLLIPAILAGLLLLSATGQFIPLAKANFFPIPIPQPAYVIQSDGSINPSSAPILRNGNTYTLTANIEGYTIGVERDNIMLDGAGFTVRGNGSSVGVFLKNRNNVMVRNMQVSNFQYGLRLFSEDVFGGNSAGNTLQDNIFENNTYGLYIAHSCGNVLRNNHMTGNSKNFWVEGGFIASDTESGYVNDVDASNTVDGKSVIYWVNRQDASVPSDAGYVALVKCNGITAQELTLSNNGQGIVLAGTVNSIVSQNQIVNCDSGIYLFNSTSNNIILNTLSNSKDGIRGFVCSNNQIASNNVTDNEKGVYFRGECTNNTFTQNSITSNTVDGINLWGSYYSSLQGNYIAFNNETGINLFESRNNNITTNNINNNIGIGMKMWYSTMENLLSENNITANNIGVLINDSYDNTIIKNTIKDNSEWGMRFESDQNNNVIYQNSFINNRPKGDGLQVSVTAAGVLDSRPGGGNVWDDGDKGNYWSDYQTRYPNATQVGSTDAGDTPYFINENNIDRYPVMQPIQIPEFPATIFFGLIMMASLLVCSLALRFKLKTPQKE